MSDRERLKAYLEQGYQKPPYFTMVDGIPSFEYPVHDNPHQFKTYAVWMKLLPIDDEKRDVVKVECLVPTCNSHISVSYNNLPLRISNWTTLTAMENERFNSSVAFIHSKLRSSLSVASVERLTLCKVYLAEALQAQDINLSNDVQVMEAMDDDDCNDALTS